MIRFISTWHCYSIIMYLVLTLF